MVALSETQGGHVNRRQLLSLGLTDRRIRYLVEIEFLIQVYTNVWAVGRRSLNPIDRCHAALLAIGERCALAGWSAGSLWGLRSWWEYPLEVITPLNRRPSGLIVHQSRALLESDITIHHGIKVISPALTILQVAPTLSGNRLERAIDDMRLEHHLELEHLHGLLGRFPRHPGAKHLRAVLQIAHAAPTRSRWEQTWRPFAAAFNLPPYAMNRMIGGYRADVLFLPRRLIVELDWGTHDTPWAGESDKNRDAELLAELGIPTMRITKRQLTDHPEVQARRILKILDRE